MMDLRRDEGCGVREGCGKTHWDKGGGAMAHIRGGEAMIEG